MFFSEINTYGGSENSLQKLKQKSSLGCEAFFGFLGWAPKAKSQCLLNILGAASSVITCVHCSSCFLIVLLGFSENGFSLLPRAL